MTPTVVVAGAVYGVLLLVGSILGIVTWSRRRRAERQWAKRSRRLLLRSLSGVDALLLGLVVLFMILLAGVVLHGMGATDQEMSPRVVMVQSVAVHWTILLAVIVLVRARGKTLRRVFGVYRGRTVGDVRRGSAAYLIMLPVVFVYAVVYRMILYALGVEVEMQDVARVLTADAPALVRVYLLFLGVCLGPLAEELLFRGVLFPVFARRLGAVGSMVVVSALFAAIHLHVPSLVPLFVLSISLCIGYALVGSIVVPVVMHMWFNAVNLVLVFLVHQS